MDELVKLVAQKTGISKEQAQTAVDTVIGYLKKKLPAPLADQVEGYLSGEGASGSIEDITKGLGGLLGDN
jgi:hypothetical protein